MSDQYRRHRIEWLLKELEYEITRSMMEREIDEEIGFRFIVPVSQKIPNGVVQCEFQTRPIPYTSIAFGDIGPVNLRLLKGDKP